MAEQNSRNPGSASKWEANSRKRLKKLELSLVLVASALGVAAFVGLDFVYSRLVLKASLHDLTLQTHEAGPDESCSRQLPGKRCNRGTRLPAQLCNR